MNPMTIFLQMGEITMTVTNKCAVVSILTIVIILAAGMIYYRNKYIEKEKELTAAESALIQAQTTIEGLKRSQVEVDKLQAKYIVKEKELQAMRMHYESKFRSLQKTSKAVNDWANQPIPTDLLKLHQESRSSGNGDGNSSK